MRVEVHIGHVLGEQREPGVVHVEHGPPEAVHVDVAHREVLEEAARVIRPAGREASPTGEKEDYQYILMPMHVDGK